MILLQTMRKWLSRRLPTKLHLFGWIVGPVLAIFFAMVFWREQEVRGVSRVSAQTELISYTVINADVIHIPIRGFRLSSGGGKLTGKCINGTLEPVLNSAVTYGRAGWGPLLVRARMPNAPQGSAAALFTPWRESRRVSLDSPVEMFFDASCKLSADDDEGIDLSKTPVPYGLPVFGRATLGSESHLAETSYPEPAMLLTATITVSAHAIMGDLYKVDTFDLPVGSRIDARLDTGSRRDASKNGEPSDAEAGANWAGVVYLDPQKPGLSAEVETDTTTLRIIRPNSRQPDIFKVTGWKEVFDDPGLIIVYKTLAVIGVLLTFSEWFWEKMFHPRPREDR